jgi:dTDP-4-amino-4,6-dideoxygalactose transaminase
MTVPFLDLKQQYLAIKDEILSAVAGVCESTQFVLGKEVAAFEQEFAAFCGVPHAVALNSGTSALHLALLAAGVGPGDEVITVPCTFVATVAAVLYTGARPVLVDVDPATYTMDPAQIEKVITPKTKALLPVHLYGNAASMDPIIAIARRHGVVVIEDAAQAHGAEYKGRRCGSMGDLGCFSFYPGKNLGAYGEGGLVTTRDPELARRMRMLRDWGAETKYQHVLKGFNYRMEGIQGAILRVKLKYLEAWTEARRRHAAAYNRLLAGGQLTLPVETPGSRHVYHIYAVLANRRDELVAFLNSQGVHASIHYPTPVHLLPAYSDLGYGAGDFPISESIATREISLPMFPEMTEMQVESVCQAVRQWDLAARREPAAAELRRDSSAIPIVA